MSASHQVVCAHCGKINRLPAETQMYVPRYEATLKKREGLTLAELKIPNT